MSAKKQPARRPISAKQLAANRANAKKSTGPRDPNSRNIVRLNGVKHGLAGRIAFLPGEDRAAYDATHNALIAELAPASPQELAVAQAIADAWWRLDRAHRVEDNMLAIGRNEADSHPDPDLGPEMRTAFADAVTFRDKAEKFVLFSLYEQRIYRSLQKNRAILNRFQADRETHDTIAVNNLPACAGSKWLWLCE